MIKRMLSLLLALCIWACAGFALPESARAESTSVYVTSNTLKVYKKANTSSKVLGVMSYGEKMTCTATKDDWAAVKNSKGSVGYCKTSGLSTKNPNKLDGKAYVKASDVPVYRRPDDDSDVMMKLKKGSAYEAVAITKDEKWVRLKNGKHYGYVQAKYLSTKPIDEEGVQPEPTAKPESNSTVYVVNNTLKVYAKASASAASLGTMAYGESMTLLAQSGDWSKVRNSAGKVGFCKSSGISGDNPNTMNETARVSAESAKVYRRPSTSANVMQTLKRGDTYRCVALTPDGDWARLKNGKHYGYVQLKYLSGISSDEEEDGADEEEDIPAFDERTVYVLETTLDVYESASESSDPLGVLSFGEELTLLNVADGWAQVRNAGGDEGYCRYGALATTNPNSQRLTYYAASKEVKLHARAQTTSRVLQTAATNAVLTAVAISEDGEWARVQLESGRYAYVLMEQLSKTPVAEENADMQDVEARPIYVSATNLALYASNSTSSASLATMSFGEELTLTGRGKGWARVETAGGVVGYCKESGLVEDDPNTYKVTLYAQKGGVKVYKRASTSSTSLMTLSLNAKVQGVALSSDKTWIRLQNGEQYGYVQAKNFATSALEDESSTSTAKKIIDLAVSYQGTPYVYAAQSPSEGFDCSGFTYYVFKKAAGISLKRTAKTQGYNNSYEKIDHQRDLKVGDLVFFNTVPGDDDLCDHVGIYMGRNQFIHASSGAMKVVISSLGSSNSDYYYRVWSWGRRVL